jgi:peptide subunit release factor 1 (eRF1)
VRALVELAAAPRSVALLIVRKGGFAVGVARGAQIVAHRTGSRYVQGRTAAGGSSQARFMRRRENQATAAYAKARDAIEAVALPYISELTAVVAAGDRRGLHTVLAERPLRPLEALLRHTMAPVGEPKRAGLDDLLAWARAVPCDVTDPPVGAAG